QPSHVSQYPSAPPPPSSSYASPYPVNVQPSNTNNYSTYSLPNVGQQPPVFQGGGGFQQSPYPPAYPGNQRPPPPPPPHSG
ncbi:unnamed protein product, partial [Rotaria sp. Silwood2]